MARIHEDIETDMRRLRRMLDRVLPKDVGTEFSALDEAPTRILDVACGACDEADTLADYFAELKAGPGGDTRADGQQVELTGIDVRAREIAMPGDAFDRGKNPDGGAAAKFEFLNGDATRLDGHRELGDNFDVVFMRHQNLWNGRRTWEEIFDKALEKLDDGGRLIITSYFDNEHHLAVETIRQLGGELITSERNTESRQLITPGKSVDRHVAVFRKKQS